MFLAVLGCMDQEKLYRKTNAWRFKGREAHVPSKGVLLVQRVGAFAGVAVLAAGATVVASADAPAGRMRVESVAGKMPELTLPALRQAVATVAPSRLPEFFEDMQKAFVQAGEEGTVLPLRMFYRQWGVVVEIERHPATARRLHAAERALGSEDADERNRAVRAAGDIVRAAHREVAGG